MSKMTGPEQYPQASAGAELAHSHPDRRRLPPVAGFTVASFVVFLLVTAVGAWADVITTNLLLCFTVTMVLGALLHWIGDRVPVLNEFGLPVILCLIVPALFVYFGLMPQGVGTMMSKFYNELGLIEFIVVAVIVGATAGLPRALLIKILARYVIPLVGVVAIVFTLIGLVGVVLGYGFVRTILFVVAPVMAGGLPLGALPMSEMYANQLGMQPSAFLSHLMSAVVLANATCILFAAMLNGIGKRVGAGFVGFNGEGQLLRVKGDLDDVTIQDKTASADYVTLAKGLMISGLVLIIGLVLAEYFTILHQFAWVVVVMAVVKIFNLFPADWEEACSRWADFVLSAFIPAFLVAISVAIIDINAILSSIRDPRFLVLVIGTVALAGVVSGALGWLVKFYAIEAAICPGLIMADMGGSGDVAVLSAAERMELMPFAAVATRFGGTLVLFVATLMVPMLSPGMLP